METQNKQNPHSRFETPQEEHEHIEELVRQKLADHPERSHEEVVDEVLRSHIDYHPYHEPAGHAPKDEDRQIEKLVQDVFQHGVLNTVDRVRATGNPWLFREFYIALHERYVQKLLEKEILKKAA